MSRCSHSDDICVVLSRAEVLTYLLRYPASPPYRLTMSILLSNILSPTSLVALFCELAVKLVIAALNCILSHTCLYNLGSLLITLECY